MTERRGEWTGNWPLPFVGMIGIAGSTLITTVSGLLIVPMTTTFGWTRAQFSFAMMLQVFVGIFAGPFFGRLVDRAGPRRIVVAGLPAVAICYLLLLFVGAPVWRWWLILALLGVAMAPVLPISWMAAIISRFDAARGLALALALAGVGLGSAIWPVVGAFVLDAAGWRATLPILGVGWVLVAFPLAWFFLPRGALSQASSVQGDSEPVRMGPTLRSGTFVLLTLAGSIFIATIYGVNVNVVPFLYRLGYSTTEGASVAGMAGLAAVIGRLLTGLLLDRTPTKPLAVGAFLLPLVSIAMLLQSEASGWTPVTAVILLGFSLGAESDIIAYVASRRFDNRIFASAYAIAGTIFGVSAALGPFLANALFDTYQSYRPFFLLAGPAILAGAMLIAFVPMERRQQ